MSRFAIDISFYILVALAQWLIQVLIVERVADPFHNFMDLCSMANISVLAMTHSLRGYYIHGRSVHGMADTNMYEMNLFLQRERENLCGLRGLENGSELQTFVVNMPRSFRDRLDQLTFSLRAATSSGVSLKGENSAIGGESISADKITIRMENTARIYAERNQFLKGVIDHVEPTCDYIITDSRLIEEMIGLELVDTTKLGSFVRCESRNELIK